MGAVGVVSGGIGCGLVCGCAGLCQRFVGLVGMGIVMSSMIGSGSMARSCDSSSFIVAALLSTSVSIIACTHTVCSLSFAVVCRGIAEAGWFVRAQVASLSAAWLPFMSWRVIIPLVTCSMVAWPLTFLIWRLGCAGLEWRFARVIACWSGFHRSRWSASAFHGMLSVKCLVQLSTTYFESLAIVVGWAVVEMAWATARSSAR